MRTVCGVLLVALCLAAASHADDALVLVTDADGLRYYTYASVEAVKVDAMGRYVGSKILCISAANGLRYTDHDAALVGAAFGKYVGFEKSNIRQLAGESATRAAILDTIRDWLKPETTYRDMIIVFFAGHGIVVNSEYYFVPSLGADTLDRSAVLDAHKKGLLLSRRELVAALREVPTPNKLVVIDTCHSGAFFGGEGAVVRPVDTAGAVVRGFDIPDPDAARGVKVIAPTVDGAPAQDGSQGVGLAVLAACRADQYAAEAAKIKNGVLTHYLVQQLKRRSRKEVVFDAGSFCRDIAELAAEDGWPQEAVSSGGEFFLIKLREHQSRSWGTF